MYIIPNENNPDQPSRSISPLGGMWPGRQGADQDQNQDYNKDCSEHGGLLFGRERVDQLFLGRTAVVVKVPRVFLT